MALGWNYAENFARRGEKARAFELMYHNWRGSPSAAAAAKMLLLLAAPHSIVERRRLRRRQSSMRHGLLDDLTGDPRGR
jgi:hypothetical protein